MIKKTIKHIQDYFRKQRDLKKSFEYYKIVKSGAAFIQFIYNDIDRHKGTLSREQRRRFEKHLADNGKLNVEIITHYASKVDQILTTIKEELNKR